MRAQQRSRLCNEMDLAQSGSVTSKSPILVCIVPKFKFMIIIYLCYHPDQLIEARWIKESIEKRSKKVRWHIWWLALFMLLFYWTNLLKIWQLVWSYHFKIVMLSWAVNLKYMVSELEEEEKDTINISYSLMTSLKATQI